MWPRILSFIEKMFFIEEKNNHLFGIAKADIYAYGLL